MKKFGGPGRLRQRCKNRRCQKKTRKDAGSPKISGENPKIVQVPIGPPVVDLQPMIDGPPPILAPALDKEDLKDEVDGDDDFFAI